MFNNKSIIFLKLGGSLITDKNTPHSARLDIIQRLVNEINQFWHNNPDVVLVLGHGSGSFGHSEAKKFGTQHGVYTAENWLGFSKVWYWASQLNHDVTDALFQSGLPVISLSPASMVTAKNRKIVQWNINPIHASIDVRLLPLLHGDVVFDEQLGGCILSTEDLFLYLSHLFKPKAVLLAGIEEGVWADYPVCKKLIKEIVLSKTNANPLSYVIQSIKDDEEEYNFLKQKDLYPQEVDAAIEHQINIEGSASMDVTGGMAAKVKLSMDIVRSSQQTEVIIFSGEVEGNVEKLLKQPSLSIGTRIYAQR